MFVAIEFIGTLSTFAGLKKHKVELEENTTVLKLIQLLNVEFLKDKQLDDPSMLVLVNGKEISVVNGMQTELQNNDIVTFIPVSHGG